MRRRPRRSIPAALVAVAGIAVSALAATSGVQWLLGKPQLVSLDAVAASAHAVAWDQPQVFAAGVVSAVLGAVLLLAAVLPGRPTVVPLTPEGFDAQVDAGASRRGVASTLRAAAVGVDGVVGSSVKVRARRVAAKVSTDRAHTDGLPESVRAAVDQRLGQLGLATSPRVKVKVASGRGSR